ncbi:hypothetical protein GCM10022281_04940 [Sphingomonas rosea]|uniref:Uncharacterized protein n=2 Tax=Sphingomonas rosea TaxID=335605 RepID=A0ABP7TNF9_9SPHN
MRPRVASFLITASLFVPANAMACEYDPFLFRLPGETVADAEQRSEAIMSEDKIVRRYNREAAAFDNASKVYLGRVTSVGPGGQERWGLSDQFVTIRLVASLKGEAPKQQRLAGEKAGSLCKDRGDGLGAFSKVGDLIVVFEGLARSDERPRGIDSIPAKLIRTVPLLDELREHGTDLE